MPADARGSEGPDFEGERAQKNGRGLPVDGEWVYVRGLGGEGNEWTPVGARLAALCSCGLVNSIALNCAAGSVEDRRNAPLDYLNAAAFGFMYGVGVVEGGGSRRRGGV